MKNSIRPDLALRYMLGGKAIVVFHNEETGNQRKYLIQAEYLRPDGLVVKFANPNYKVHRFKVFGIGYDKPRYLGDIKANVVTGEWIFRDDPKLLWPKESSEFRWAYNLVLLQKVPPNLHILHIGTCSVCGRPLTDAISLETGIGPICGNRLKTRKQ